MMRPKFIPPLSWQRKATPQQAILAQWRRIDLQEEEKARKHSARPVGNVVNQVLQEIGLDKKRGELEIQKVWNNCLNPVVTAHAQPIGLAKGTLFVQVDSNAWQHEIVVYHRKEILSRLQHAFGPDLIQRLSFRVAG